MHDSTPRGRTPRPLADAAVHRLLARSREIAKRWLLELIEARPLERAEGLPAGRLAAAGPRLCEAVIAALLSDEGLAELGGGGALEPLLADVGELIDACSAEEVSAGLESLRGVIWTAVRREQPNPDPELVWALGERLSVALEAVRAVALRGFAGRPTDPFGVAGSSPFVVKRAGGSPPPAAGELRQRLIDELARANRESRPSALLRIELEEAERIRAVEGHDWPGFEGWEDAVRLRLRRDDVLIPSGDGSAWVIVRGAERDAVRDLAARLAAAAGELADWHGAPLSAAVGVAVLAEDGTSPETLMAAAEEARFAASAAGVAVGPPGT